MTVIPHLLSSFVFAQPTLTIQEQRQLYDEEKKRLAERDVTKDRAPILAGVLKVRIVGTFVWQF